MRLQPRGPVADQRCVHVSRIVAAVVGVVLVLVTAVTAVVGFSYDARQREVASTDVRRAALQSLGAELDGLVATTHQVAGLFAASEGVSPQEFRTFTLPLLRDGSASAFGWIPHVTDAQRAAWERRHHVRIGQNGKVVPAPRRATYDPTEMLETAFDVKVPLGLDAGAQPARRRALRAAAMTSEPQATPVTTLVGSNARGILVYASVLRPDGRLRGSAVGTFRVAQLTRAMSAVLPKGAAFELRQGGRRVGGHGKPPSGADSWSVDVAGQRWHIVTSPAASARLGNGVIALLVGGLLTALVLLTLSKLARDAGRAERKASQSEERFSHAFDAAPVGMALLDASGRHVKVNEALARLLGYSRDGLTGLGAEDIMPPEEAAACHSLVAALLRGDQTSFRGDTNLRTVDGRRVRVAVHMTLLEGTPGGDAPILVHAVDVTEQRLAERRMRHLADHDPLTGLLNRRGFAAALGSQVAHSRRYGAEGALLILDLDGFKGINDTLGHDAGDRLLVEVSAALTDCLRETDVVARLGGDEFAVILPRETLDEASVVASKITVRLREARLGAVGSTLAGVTVSVGVAPFADEFLEGEDVLRAADLAMYSAKAAGRDRHAVHGRHADVV
jgi:diguanylate cyclase (GGDEF)-like protein/PAS domain S-box-containing protein